MLNLQLSLRLLVGVALATLVVVPGCPTVPRGTKIDAGLKHLLQTICDRFLVRGGDKNQSKRLPQGGQEVKEGKLRSGGSKSDVRHIRLSA